MRRKKGIGSELKEVEEREGKKGRGKRREDHVNELKEEVEGKGT